MIHFSYRIPSTLFVPHPPQRFAHGTVLVRSDIGRHNPDDSSQTIDLNFKPDQAISRTIPSISHGYSHDIVGSFFFFVETSFQTDVKTESCKLSIWKVISRQVH